MVRKLFFAVFAAIVALCTVSCSESTSEKPGKKTSSTEKVEEKAPQKELKQGVVFRKAIVGRMGQLCVLLEDGTSLGCLKGNGAIYLEAGDTITYYRDGAFPYVEEIRWKK